MYLNLSTPGVDGADGFKADRTHHLHVPLCQYVCILTTGPMSDPNSSYVGIIHCFYVVMFIRYPAICGKHWEIFLYSIKGYTREAALN